MYNIYIYLLYTKCVCIIWISIYCIYIYIYIANNLDIHIAQYFMNFKLTRLNKYHQVHDVHSNWMKLQQMVCMRFSTSCHQWVGLQDGYIQLCDKTCEQSTQWSLLFSNQDRKPFQVPSCKRLRNYGKSAFLTGKL